MRKETIRIPKNIINSHCHGRDMEEKKKTTIHQTLLESRRSLISTTFFMPNTEPPITDFSTLCRYFEIIEKARKLHKINDAQYIYFGVTDRNLKDCETALGYPCVIGLKVYPIGVTTGKKIGVKKKKTIVQAMRLAEKHRKAIAFHCDDPEVIAREGNTVNAEVAYAEKVIDCARSIPSVRVVVCHVSCQKSAQLILEVQREGLEIAIEITPHHLMFTADGFNWNPHLNKIFYHCLNKLRSRDDVEFLRYLIKTEVNNPLIFIGSDSAPHTEFNKLVDKAAGIPSHQEMVPVILTLAEEYGIPEEQITNLLSFNASEFFRIPVNRQLKSYRLEKRINNLSYNRGKIVNPWNGVELLFPAPIRGRKK